MQQQPSVGRIVHVLVDPKKNNGSPVAPAIITRVWAPCDAPHTDASGAGAYCVNLKIFYDGEAAPGYATSAYLFSNEDAAHTSLGKGAMVGSVCFWPPKA
ncbi:hypothetical protein OIE66_40535 [Nonomuraea sp. NBC_01738]|uniref:hypothetical protein n=1 Tax=Nonomuraea sp. NBC_01738 TaxID=2976003 RepID=UPI002E159416|nr:hypothetical protein OIE66_40535 [Nonomuraea sp. NBC_01738]